MDTLIFAGLRRSEACWLRWEDLHLDADRPLMFIRAKEFEGERWEPKNGRDRIVPLNRIRLLPLLNELPRVSTWTFPSPRGYRWDGDNLSQHFSSLMKKAGLDVNFLTLRHTFGSQLAQRGISLYEISQSMGNSPEIARRHYARLCPEKMHERIEF